MKRTLFIGLGGLGGKVIMCIKKQAQLHSARTQDDVYVILDTNEYDYRDLRDISFINLHPQKRVGQCIEHHHRLGVADWFPASRAMMYEFGVPMGLRAGGRLAFLDGMETGKLKKLETLAYKAFMEATSLQDIQVVIVSSLAGGAGSGMFIQTALWIRRLLQNKWGIPGNIFGLLVGPEIFIDAFLPDRREMMCEQLRGNAHASLLELQLITALQTGGQQNFSPKIELDGLLDMTSRRPVFDRVSLYDVWAESGKRSFDEHIEAIARGAMLFYGEQLPMPLLTANQNEIVLTQVGSSLAYYPKEEVVRYCALRAGRDWARVLTEEVTGAEETDQLSRFMEQLMKMLQETIEKERCLEDGLKADGEITTEEDIKDALALLDRLGKSAFSRADEISEVLLRRVVSHDAMAFGDRQSPLGLLLGKVNDRGDMEYFAPNVIRGLLKSAAEMLRVSMEENPISAEVDFLAECPVPRRFGKGKIAATRQSAYPLLVWNENWLSRSLSGSKFRQAYSEWFGEYCRWIIKESHRCMTKRVIDRLFPRLIAEIKQLLETEMTLDTQLLQCLNEEEYGPCEGPFGVVKLCAAGEKLSKIYARLPAVTDVQSIHKSYVKMLWGRYCYQCRPEYMENRAFADKRCYISLYDDIIEQLERKLLRTAPEMLAPDLSDALQLETDEANGLQALVAQLEQLARESLPEVYGRETPANAVPGQIQSGTVFGARDLQNRVCLTQGRVNAGAVPGSLKDTAVWCLQLTHGVELGNCTVLSSPRYGMAYSRLIEQARQGAVFCKGIHLDMRWCELFS